MSGVQVAGSQVAAPRMAGRRIIGAVLSVLAGLLAPVAILAGWAQTLTTDTDKVVAAYAVLVDRPEVQDLLNRQLTEQITAALPLGGNLPVVQQTVARVVTEFTTSDAFSAAWSASLRAAHSELRGLLTDEPGRLVARDGVVHLRLAPFAEAIKQRLVESGVPFADRLPEIDASIPLLTIDAQTLATVQAGHRQLTWLAPVLPLLVVGLSLLALWVWPRRGALGWLGGSLLTGACLLWLGSGFIGDRLVAMIGEQFQPVARIVIDITQRPLVEPTLTIAVLGGLAIFLAAVIAPAPAD